MKLFALLVVATLFISPKTSLAQDVSLNDLISIRNGDIELVNTTLLNKNWYFKGREEKIYSQDSCEYEQVVWRFGSNTDYDIAKGFINLYKSESCSTFVGYIVFNLQSYQKIRQAITKNGMHLLSSTTDIDKNDGLPYTESIFVGQNYKIIINIVNQSTQDKFVPNRYQIYVYKK